jgi:hypothetical protein
VVRVLHESSKRTAALLFGNTPVRFPLTIATVDSYSEAK